MSSNHPQKALQAQFSLMCAQRWPKIPFINLFIHSIIYLIHSFLNSFTHSLMHSFILSFIIPFIHSFIYSCEAITHILAHSSTNVTWHISNICHSFVYHNIYKKNSQLACIYFVCCIIHVYSCIFMICIFMCIHVYCIFSRRLSL